MKWRVLNQLCISATNAIKLVPAKSVPHVVRLTVPASAKLLTGKITRTFVWHIFVLLIYWVKETIFSTVNIIDLLLFLRRLDKDRDKQWREILKVTYLMLKIMLCSLLLLFINIFLFGNYCCFCFSLLKSLFLFDYF